jgi:hypothetical protein
MAVAFMPPLNTAVDFRGRLRFPRVTHEPPDMNETVKILTPH